MNVCLKEKSRAINPTLIDIISPQLLGLYFCIQLLFFQELVKEVVQILVKVSHQVVVEYHDVIVNQI